MPCQGDAAGDLREGRTLTLTLTPTLTLTLQAINAGDVPVAVGSDANQKSKTRMLKDGTITAAGGLKFSECLYLARQEELYRGGKPDMVLTLTLTLTQP